MIPARLRLVLAAVMFLGWLGWLFAAVYKARWAPDAAPVVSRAQLTAATHILVCDVTLDPSGIPAAETKVVAVLRGTGVAPGDSITVRNLPSALPPGTAGPSAGVFLLPVVGEGKVFAIAGLPRSPGYEATAPARPAIYAWRPDLRSHLRGLGIGE